ncbi:MAG: PLP-dependent transferase, partial [Deinococcus sp.]|nr:PLP-dependent transferase [Deinococcus sp.]
VPGPLDCWLVTRGIKTLALRMTAHCRNAQLIAEFLSQDRRVKQVFYPGLPTDPGHALAEQQMSGFGGMVSFIPSGGEAAARRLVAATKLFALAESLGGVESLIELPAAMTHASTAGSSLEVSPALVRLSVGIEHPDDLIADLDQALSA